MKYIYQTGGKILLDLGVSGNVDIGFSDFLGGSGLAFMVTGIGIGDFGTWMSVSAWYLITLVSSALLEVSVCVL